MVGMVLDLEEPVLAMVASESQRRGIGITSYINQILKSVVTGPDGPAAKPAELGDLLRQAVDRAEQLPPKSEFNLEKLFSADEWEALGSGERKSFGRRFKKAVADIAEHVGRTSGNKAIYKRR